MTTDRLSACLTVLSQDSGLGSSQEQPSTVNSSQELQTLAWDKVVVPENLIVSCILKIHNIFIHVRHICRNQQQRIV